MAAAEREFYNFDCYFVEGFCINESLNFFENENFGLKKIPHRKFIAKCSINYCQTECLQTGYWRVTNE